jgi:hypothetical protein
LQVQRQKDSIFNDNDYSEFLFEKLEFLFEAFSSILRFAVLDGAWVGLGLAKAWSLQRFAFEVVKKSDVFLHCFDVILRIFDVF